MCMFNSDCQEPITAPVTVKHTLEPLYNSHFGGHFGETEESGHRRGGRFKEVETRVNVWTVRPQKWPS